MCYWAIPLIAFGLIGLFVGTFKNVVFWVLYTQTGNIPSSMVITGATTIGFIGFLSYLGKVDKRRKNTTLL
jgi:hypothetical protein